MKRGDYEEVMTDIEVYEKSFHWIPNGILSDFQKFPSPKSILAEHQRRLKCKYQIYVTICNYLRNVYIC